MDDEAADPFLAQRLGNGPEAGAVAGGGGAGAVLRLDADDAAGRRRQQVELRVPTASGRTRAATVYLQLVSASWPDMDLLARQRPPDEGRARPIAVSPYPWSRPEKLSFSEARVVESSCGRRMA